MTQRALQWACFFDKEETLAGYCNVLKQILEQHGIPETEEEVIYKNFKELLESKDYSYNAMRHATDPYGTGYSCKRMADILALGGGR